MSYKHHICKNIPYHLWKIISFVATSDYALSLFFSKVHYQKSSLDDPVVILGPLCAPYRHIKILEQIHFICPSKYSKPILAIFELSKIVHWQEIPLQGPMAILDAPHIPLHHTKRPFQILFKNPFKIPWIHFL